MKRLVCIGFLIMLFLAFGIRVEGKIFFRNVELTDIIVFDDFKYDDLRDQFLKQIGVDINYVKIRNVNNEEVTQFNYRGLMNNFENNLTYEYRDIFGKKIFNNRKVFILPRQEFMRSISVDSRYDIKNVSVDTVYNDVTSGKILVGKVFTEPELPDNKNCYILKLDRNNKISWGKVFEDSKINKFNKIINIQSDEYCLIASAYRNSEWTDGLIIKFNEDGDILWKEFYGSSHIDDFKDVISVNDGELIVLAEVSNCDGEVEVPITINNPLNKDLVVLKYSKDGRILWQNSVTSENELIALKIINEENRLLVLGEIFDNSEIKNVIVSGFDLDGKRKFSTIVEDSSVDFLNKFLD